MAQPGLEKVAAETPAGQIGSEAEPDLDRVLPGVLELEEAGELAGLVLDGDVLVSPQRRVEQLGKVVRVG